MSVFIGWLEEMNGRDTRVRATLRRSLSFDPGAFAPAYPYVEPFIRGDVGDWKRKMHYLAAGLWASHWKEGRSGEAVSVGKACALYKVSRDSGSIERRFINFLDSDPDQLANRLRHVVSLLGEYAIDFEGLLNMLCSWNDERKWVQNALARDFYRDLPSGNEEEEFKEKETGE